MQNGMGLLEVPKRLTMMTSKFRFSNLALSSLVEISVSVRYKIFVAHLSK